MTARCGEVWSGNRAGGTVWVGVCVCAFAREAEVKNLKSSYTPPLWHHS